MVEFNPIIEKKIEESDTSDSIEVTPQAQTVHEESHDDGSWQGGAGAGRVCDMPCLRDGSEGIKEWIHHNIKYEVHLYKKVQTNILP